MKYTFTGSAFLLVSLLHAQTSSNAWRFGVKTDLNLSTIKGNGMATGYATGAQFGGYAEKLLGTKWSIQPELVFIQSNTKKAADFTTYYNIDGNMFASDNIKLGYISIPVLMKYKLNKYLSLMTGPSTA